MKRRDSNIPRLPFNYGSGGRYLYVLNGVDQTVSVIDTDSHTVIETITLPASKTFCSIFYRAITQTVYVLGNQYHAVIDANPSSVNFLTVLSEGATVLLTSQSGQMFYLAWPYDCITNGGYRVPIDQINTLDQLTYNEQMFYTLDSRYRGNQRHGHSIHTHGYVHPVNCTLQVNGNMYVINRRSGKMKNGFPYEESRGQLGIQQDLVILNGLYTIIFGNFHIGHGGQNTYFFANEATTSPILDTVASTLGTTKKFSICCPNAKILVCAEKTNIAGSFGSIKNDVIDLTYGNPTIRGIIDRTAYKATNETSVKDMVYSPYSGKFYIQPMHITAAQATGVNKIHWYDPMQANVADMYQGSIDVGEMNSTEYRNNYANNAMCLDYTVTHEHPDIYI